jgi:hypothetical protein
VSGGMSLASAITALAAEKRAVGYKYDAEERVLARFEAFCRSGFPGLGTVTRASAEAWCCPTLKIAMKAALAIPMWGRCKAPQPWWLRGLGGDGAGGRG